MPGAGKQHSAADRRSSKIKCAGCGNMADSLVVAADIKKPRCSGCVAKARGQPASQSRSVRHLASIKKNDEYGTPYDVYAAGCRYFGIIPELDVAASRTLRVRPDMRYYTKRDDALTKPWDVPWWCNPPYSRVREFLEYGLQQVRSHGAPGLFLVYSKTDTRWWWDIVQPYCRHRFIRGRVRFTLPRGGAAEYMALYPSVLIYMDGKTVRRRPPQLPTTAAYMRRVM